jgi:hypothetical protein
MVNMIAPTVEELIHQLMPWLAFPFESESSSRDSSEHHVPPHGPAPPPSAIHVYVPVSPLPVDTLDLPNLTEAQFNSSATPNLPVVLNHHFPWAVEPGTLVDLKFHAIDMFKFQITNAYLVIPLTAYLEIDVNNPTRLDIYSLDDNWHGALDFHKSVRDVMFPPNRSFTPPRYTPGQTLSYASAPGQVSFFIEFRD